jgi:hypothetical protein
MHGKGRMVGPATDRALTRIQPKLTLRPIR